MAAAVIDLVEAGVIDPVVVAVVSTVEAEVETMPVGVAGEPEVVAGLTTAVPTNPIRGERTTVTVM